MCDLWIGYFSGVLPREPMPTNITVRLPSSEDLDAYAAQQWEVCNFLIYLCIFFLLITSFVHLCINILFHCSLCKSVRCWPLVMCSFSILLAALFLTCNCWKSVFLAAPYKFQWSWNNKKHQLLYDESFPARPIESKVLFTLISFIIVFCWKFISITLFVLRKWGTSILLLM